LFTNVRLGLQRLTVTNTLAYYDKEVVTVLKRFRAKVPGINVINLFSPASMTVEQNKLDRFPGDTTFSIMTFSIMTFSIMTLSIKGLFVTLGT
jgi:hypothetical protein